jgi:hypothetical protein
VTGEHANQYVTHPLNSGFQIQSVRRKLLTPLGVEIGHAWKMSKDIYDLASAAWDRSFRGSCWRFGVVLAESVGRSSSGAGYRCGDIGLSLVRRLSQQVVTLKANSFSHREISFKINVIITIRFLSPTTLLRAIKIFACLCTYT